jgi:hypothetical protein
MSDHAILLWTFLVTVIGVLAGLLALVVAWKTIRDAQKQARDNARTGKTQFWIMLRGVFAWYDDVHASFRPGGKWHGSGAPQTAEDMARIELYLGLFEYCDRLLEENLVDSQDFGRSYNYRLSNALKNRWVVGEKLVNRRKDWLRFINLCYRSHVEMPADVLPLKAEELSSLYSKGKGAA